MIDRTINLIRQNARPISETAANDDALMDFIGDANIVLMGEASHGTHDFYYERAQISRRLVAEKGFSAIAVEADWPDAYRINRFVRGMGEDLTPRESVGDFRRFPTWMWRNTDVLNFIDGLRQYNDNLPENSRKVGFYGLDLYSLYTSIAAVLQYLDRVDPEAAQRARDRYNCFGQFGEEPQEYGFATAFGLTKSCENEVVNQLLELQRQAADYAQRDGSIPEDEFFYAEWNAQVIKDAEEYYRAMFRGQVSSWNLRDRHMGETLDRLIEHGAREGEPMKVIVWAHNSHLGDARATQMGDRGELNLGQLARERYGNEVVSVGFTTHTGTVAAASDWDAPVQLKRVRPSMGNSYENLFHRTQMERFWLSLREEEIARSLESPRLERAIGVIYRPETERASHYFYASLSRQFDAIIHVDNSRAVEPLDRIQPEPEDLPETYPHAI
ncbi:MAG: erythromycin esterase family protein [Limnospira sp.]